MLTAKDYLQRIGSIMNQPVNGDKLSLSIAPHWENEEQAHKFIEEYRLMQKELRLLKKEINITIQEISRSYVSQRTGVGKGVGSGFLRGFFGSRTAGKINVITRNNITRQKDRAIKPYRNVVTGIDTLILGLDKLKVKIETDLLSNKSL